MICGVIKVLKNKNMEEAINNIIASEHREEALLLTSLAPEYRINELLQFYKDDDGNLFCACLDVIKFDLYKEGKIEKNEFPNFGEPFMSFDDEL